jgi:hypothetical protein
MPTATTTKTQSKRRDKPARQTKGQRDQAHGSIIEDDSLERDYARQTAKAKAKGEPTSIAEEMDQQYEAGRKEGEQSQARTATTSSVRLTSLPSGSLGVGNMLAPLLVETVIISADEFISYHRWPVPSRFLAAFAVFGTLSLASGSASRPAAVTAWGLVLATTYAFISKSPDIFAGIGNFFGGSPTAANPVTTLPLAKPISQPIA